MSDAANANPPDDKFGQFLAALQESGKSWIAGLNSMQRRGNFAESYRQWVQAMRQDPKRFAELQQGYIDEHMKILQRVMSPGAAEGQAAGDKRFSGGEWQGHPAFNYLAQSYLATSRLFMQALDGLELEPEKKRRMRFFAKQYLDAISPSNYLMTNPEALKKALETQGESLRSGMDNLHSDVEKGRISMTDEAAFEVGRNLAVSEGSVVFENELIQLIQYKPLTDMVYARPLLLVPPCINKFYILDMLPQNSLVRYAVEQGHTVFMVSWRNVKADLGHLTWDHYIAEGVVAAIDTARQISNCEKINVLGFCVGGTLVASALAILDRMGHDVAESLTLLTAFIDFSEVGEISAYIDDAFVERCESGVGKGGIVPGADLAFAFSSLRANELVWNYVVNNYLKGESPPAFDLLYWNGDSTNLPGPMYAYYLRNTYVENNLIVPDKLTMCGVPVDVGRVDMPAFVFAAREDHIVPWRTAFEGARYLGGDVEFVLGASGHIAGVVNPASKNRRSYWDGGPIDHVKDTPDSWLAHTPEIEGSWWPRWMSWLQQFGGKRVPAPRQPGNAKFAPIEPAPGRYVLEKAN
jgi:polyhydroxyalkanoate synthase